VSSEEQERQCLDATIRRIEAEQKKLELETQELQQRLSAKWYSTKHVVQSVVGGIVASALLAAWLVGYFQPILRKQQEIDSLETKRLSIELGLREQDLKQQQIEAKRTTDTLASERDESKAELELLLSINKALQGSQKSTEDLAAKLKIALYDAQRRVRDLAAQKNLTDQEKEQLAAASRSATARIEALAGEVEKLRSARAETANQSAQLTTQLRTRDIVGKDVRILFPENSRPTAMKAKAILESLGANVQLRSGAPSTAFAGKIFYYSPEHIEAAKQIADQLAKIQTILPSEGEKGRGPQLNLWLRP
jgi:hypothetical protein